MMAAIYTPTHDLYTHRLMSYIHTYSYLITKRQDLYTKTQNSTCDTAAIFCAKLPSIAPRSILPAVSIHEHHEPTCRSTRSKPLHFEHAHTCVVQAHSTHTHITAHTHSNTPRAHLPRALTYTHEHTHTRTHARTHVYTHTRTHARARAASLIHT